MGFFEDLFGSLLEQGAELLSELISEGIGTFFVFEDLVTGVIDTSKIDALYKISYGVTLSYLVIKLLQKGFMTYVMERDGDPDTSPLELIKNSFIAMFVVAIFPELYLKGASIFQNILTKYLEVIFHVDPSNLIENVVDMILGWSIAKILVAIIFIIICFMILVNLCKISFQLLILRIGFPFATVGILNSDYGVLAPVIKLFFQIAFTIIVQVFSLVTAMGLVFSPNSNFLSMILGISIGSSALATHHLLTQILVQIKGSGGGAVNKVGSMAHTVSAVKGLIT